MIVDGPGPPEGGGRSSETGKPAVYTAQAACAPLLARQSPAAMTPFCYLTLMLRANVRARNGLLLTRNWDDLAELQGYQPYLSQIPFEQVCTSGVQGVLLPHASEFNDRALE